MNAFYVSVVFEVRRTRDRLRTEVAVFSCLERVVAETQEAARNQQIGRFTSELCADWETLRVLSCLSMPEEKPA